MPKGQTTTKRITQPYPGVLVARSDRDDRTFLLFRVPYRGKAGWSQFKLECRTESVLKVRKANWWLSYNLSINCLAKGRDAKLLADHSPEVHRWLMAILPAVTARQIRIAWGIEAQEQP